MKRRSPRFVAVFQALLVTFLWSTSFVIIKLGLEDLPPLTFAGLRYASAALCLLPFALRSPQRAVLRTLSRATWGQLLLLGLTQFGIMQGAHFLALNVLPNNLVSLSFNFATIIVAFTGYLLLKERTVPLQWVGLAIFLGGLGIYFTPLAVPAAQAQGLVAMGIAIVAATFSSILGRAINRSRQLSALLVTAVSMTFGSVVLLIVGLLVQGLPPLTWRHGAMIGWLAVANTAFAFTLWNHTQRTLTAVQSTSIADMTTLQVVLWSWLFLGETLTARQLLGMVIAAGGGVLVQIARGRLAQREAAGRVMSPA